MYPMWEIWLIISVVFLLLELFTVSLVSIWFVIGSLVAMILALSGVSVLGQLAAMLIVSVVLLVIFLAFKNKLSISNKDRLPTNLEALMGEEAIVIAEIGAQSNPGQVKLKGQVWTAIAEDAGQVIPLDSKVTVTGIQGVKLIVKPEANVPNVDSKERAGE